MEDHEARPINLAIQGGGAHGALSWGALDRLLEDGRLTVEAVSACSAGTMNALALAQGLEQGGSDRARQELEKLWRRVSEVGQEYSPLAWVPGGKYMKGLNLGNPLVYFFFDAMTRMFSPYQLNPFDFNPVREVLDGCIDFERLAASKQIKLFISATNVRTGNVRVFATPEITIDVALASACLPFLFKAVEVKGEHYWDGGYMGNPSLYPLFYRAECNDLMIIHVNPIVRDKLPVTAPEIINRANEISFNASLLKELRAIAFVQKLIERDMLKEEHKGGYRNIRVHSVRTDAMMKDEDVANKFNTDWDFLTKLRDEGRKIMGEWLEKNYHYIGHSSSVDLNRDFLGKAGSEV